MRQNAKISKKLNFDIVDLAILYETIVSYISKINPKSIKNALPKHVATKLSEKCVFATPLMHFQLF